MSSSSIAMTAVCKRAERFTACLSLAPSTSNACVAEYAGALDASRHGMHTFRWTKLRPDTVYDVRVRFAELGEPSGPARTLTVHSRFVTFPDATCHNCTSTVRILFGSCMARGMFPFDSLSVFDFVLSHIKPTFGLLLGDLAYRDISRSFPISLSSAQAFTQTFADASLGRFLNAVPSAAMYDDHDFLGNDYDSSMSADDDWSVFARFAGDRNPAPVRAGDHYFSFDYGPISIFVLETRSRRSAHSAVDDASKTMLGSQQRTDLLDWLASSHARLKLIASPVSWAVYGDGASFDTETRSLIDVICSRPERDVILVSGDSHWGAVYSWGALNNWRNDCLVEVSASPFQALPFPSPDFLSPGTDLHSLMRSRGERVHFHSSSAFHFGVLQLELSAGRVRASASIYRYGVLDAISRWWTGEPREVFRHEISLGA